MDNLDDSENAKISDSAYSNSCSNSQSRRSHSSKSTHSGSNSSGSSGYGGKPSTSGSSNNLGQQPKKEKKEKETKKKKSTQADTIVPEVVVETEVRPPEPTPDFDVPIEEAQDVISTPPPVHAPTENVPEKMDISTSERNSVINEVVPSNSLKNHSANALAAHSTASYSSDGFSCVISMHDGVVIYTTSSLTTTLGFPKHMWIGRSFIDFIHPTDRSTFASQITSGLAIPKIENGRQEKAQCPANSVSTMVCRIRRYRGLTSGFGVKDKTVTFMPFLLKLTFKNVNDEEGKITYLVIQATPFFSAFKTPYEILTKVVPFVIRHAANGNIEYVDPESVPYLGHLPQDLAEKNALQLYHPEDLNYLRQVYETIVKEGGLPRSKTYRMITHNGDYLKLETEWSSFINPWSKKLEFVIGKHHIIEGPANPDVFQAPDSDKSVKVSEEEKNKVQILRDNIIRIMNEVLTKPAEVAKQQMSKRCQDLASFMETLMEEEPKPDDELRLEIQDADHSYYERDSVMLGGISPHHDCNESKSSTETPLSYNQLNYNDNLQRYFDSQQPYLYEDYNTNEGFNIIELKNTSSNFLPVQNSGDSGEMASSCDSKNLAIDSDMGDTDYQPVRLTETLLTKSPLNLVGRQSTQRLPLHDVHFLKPQQAPSMPQTRPTLNKYNLLIVHNAEMEKELTKMHRVTRSSSKGEREKASNETRKKKKEHLARCNASFQPTSAGDQTIIENQPHGIKRASKHLELENSAHKHHCPSPRAPRRKQRTLSTSVAVAQPTTSHTTTAQTTTIANQWATPSVSNMNTFIMGVGIPQQMSMMNPMAGVTGMFPMYYTPAAQTAPVQEINNPPPQYQGAPMTCMMYGQPMYGSSFMYSPINPQLSYPMQQTMMPQTMMYNNTLNPLGLASRNYEEACKPGLQLRPRNISGLWRKKRSKTEAISSQTENSCPDNNSSTKALTRETGANCSQSGNEKSTLYSTDMKSSSISCSVKSTEAVPDTPPSRDRQMHPNKRLGNSDGTVDRTDGESSYSSFYSSFFKTESGSAEDSDAKKADMNKNMKGPTNGNVVQQEPNSSKKVPKRKDPPWMEQVCVTSELIYKYQIFTKSMDEVLTADKEKISAFEQPSLVNDQLGQLYLDLQLEGVAARLTLEEGITSSSSSGEDSSSNVVQSSRRKCEHSKLVMIYEEDAPLPPPTPEAIAEDPEEKPDETMPQSL